MNWTLWFTMDMAQHTITADDGTVWFVRPDQYGSHEWGRVHPDGHHEVYGDSCSEAECLDSIRDETEVIEREPSEFDPDLPWDTWREFYDRFS